MSLVNSYSLIPFTTSLAVAALGLTCFWKNHSSRAHQLFFLLCLSVVPWPFALGVMLNLHQATDVVWWTKAGHITCTIGPAVYFDFVITYLGLREHRRFRSLAYAYYAYIPFAVYGTLATDWYFLPAEVYRYSWGPYAKGGWMAAMDAAFGATVALTSWLLMFQRMRSLRRQADLQEYNRFKYLVAALGFFSFALLDYLPKYGMPILPVGSLFILGFAATVTYAILKHQVLDFTIAIRRTAIYSILAALITAVYLVVVLVMERGFQGFFGYRSLVTNVVVGFAIALGFNPLRDVVQRLVDRWFFTKSTPALVEENERLRQEVAQSDRMKAVATLAAGMAHEIKNPLTSIKTFAEYLPQKYDDPQFRDRFAKIMAQEVDKMNALVHRLLEFARPAEPQLKLVSLKRVIDETLDLLQGTLLKNQIQTQTIFDPTDTIYADEGQLKQALLNVILNSIEAMPGPGRIAVSTVRQNGSIAIVVADSGPGIAKKDFQHIFDPFYTTKAGGTGLGLSVVHSIVRQHGGRVAVESEIGKGTTIRMVLPVQQGGQHGAAAHSHCR